MNDGRSRRAGHVVAGVAVVFGLVGCGAAGAASPGAVPAGAGAATAPPVTDAVTASTSASTAVAGATVAGTTRDDGGVANTALIDAAAAGSTVGADVPTTGAPITSAPPPEPPPTTIFEPAVRSGANVNVPTEVGDPLRIVVPSVGIDGPIVPSGLLADNTIAVPEDPKVAGWFTGASRPGELGPSVIVGHVDSRKFGLGVFWGLDKVAVGALVTVETTQAEQHFTVVAVQQIPKVDFPTADVYGVVPNASLRLITCGGSFDRSIGHYRDNVVIYLEKING